LLPALAAAVAGCLHPAPAAADPVRYWGADAELSVSAVSERTVLIALAPLDENGQPRPATPSTALVPQKLDEQLRRRELKGAEEAGGAREPGPAAGRVRGPGREGRAGAGLLRSRAGVPHRRPGARPGRRRPAVRPPRQAVPHAQRPARAPAGHARRDDPGAVP